LKYFTHFSEVIILALSKASRFKGILFRYSTKKNLTQDALSLLSYYFEYGLDLMDLELKID
jgi:hypothetical protein